MAPTPSIPASATAALGKAPNAMGTPEARAQKLADMRAFLLAKKRSNTPAKFADVKAEATSRPQTPSQLPHKPQVAASQHPPPKEKEKEKETSATPNRADTSSDVDALLAEGQAVARVRSQNKVANVHTAASSSVTQNGQEKQTTDPVATLEEQEPNNLPEVMGKAKAEQTLSNKFQESNTAATNAECARKQATTAKQNREQEEHTSAGASRQDTKPAQAGTQRSTSSFTSDTVTDVPPSNQGLIILKPGSVHPNGAAAVQRASAMSPKQPKQTVSESKQVANGLQGNEDYYADLELWLQITGFHDPAIRESKLKTYKIRKNLEERKRALEEEFAELERREAAEAQELRAPSVRAQSVVVMPPPPLPASASMIVESPKEAMITPKSQTVATPTPLAGTKRGISPGNDQHAGKFHRVDVSARSSRKDELLDKPLSAGPGSNHR